MKKKIKTGFIYFRYVFPMIAVACMAGVCFVPAYRYITADTGINQPISMWTLIGNAWDTVRAYLFGGGKQEAVVVDFSWTTLLTIIALVLLFLVGAASTVYAAVSAFRYFGDGCRESRARALFVTLAPNRIVLCVYHALTLPVFAFPLVMASMYDKILGYHVELAYSSFDMGLVAIALYAATVVMIAVSAARERRVGYDLFVKRVVNKTAEAEWTEESVEEQTEPRDAYDDMADKAKREQTERILRLLTKQNDDTKEDDQ